MVKYWLTVLIALPGSRLICHCWPFPDLAMQSANLQTTPAAPFQNSDRLYVMPAWRFLAKASHDFACTVLYTGMQVGWAYTYCRSQEKIICPVLNLARSSSWTYILLSLVVHQPLHLFRCAWNDTMSSYEHPTYSQWQADRPVVATDLTVSLLNSGRKLFRCQSRRAPISLFDRIPWAHLTFLHAIMVVQDVLFMVFQSGQSV